MDNGADRNDHESPELTRSLSAAERETTVTTTDSDETVRIHTTRRRHIGELKRNAKFTLVAEGTFGTTAWAEFTIADSDWSPATGAKRRAAPMTEERKAKLREQLASRRKA